MLCTKMLRNTFSSRKIYKLPKVILHCAVYYIYIWAPLKPDPLSETAPILVIPAIVLQEGM